MSDTDFEAMAAAVVAGDAALARELARGAVRDGADLVETVERGFAAGVRRVGELWEEGDYFLPELVQGAEAMKAAMSVLGPALADQGREVGARARVVLGTVEGDLHDIGKSLVATLLAANGFEVHDLGTNVSPAAFVDKAREVDAHLVGASALLTTTMTTQRRVVEALAAADLPRRPRVMVGGAPTSPAWAESIGAVHADSALEAVRVAAELVR